MKTWFRMKVQEDDPSIADIYIYDFIGDWIDEMLNEVFGEEVTVTAKAFVEELEKLPDSVKALRVHVNSPGGDVFGAVAIANALRDQRLVKGRAVETSIEGLAASAASIIVQAGDPIRMGDNSLIMIHNPWTLAIGEADELRKDAQDLDTIRNGIISTYQWHSELSEDEIGALMDATTWLEADEAIEKGFATEKVEGLKAVASIGPRGLTKLAVPEKYSDRVKALVKPEPKADAGNLALDDEEPAQATEVLRLCREGDCLDIAESLIEDGLSIERVQSRVKAEVESRANAKARATEIQGLCEKAKLPELADGYIRGQMSSDDVRAHLTAFTARLDRAEIDGGLEPDNGYRPKAKINVSQVYADRNRLLTAGNKKE
jgi:ATP-dependent protease ClpP protease subunit